MWIRLLERMKASRALGLWSLVVASACFWHQPAHATDVYITAEFMPNIHDPNKRTFTNTTPWWGICSGAHLNICKANNWWSIDTKITGTRTNPPCCSPGFGRNSVYVDMPAPRNIIITNGEDAYPLTLRIIGAGIRYTADDGDLSPGDSGGVNSSCSLGLTNGSYPNRSVMRMFLKRNGGSGAGGCAINWLRQNTYRLTAFDFVYALDAVSPLTMKSGTYTATVNYTVGQAGADFDLGDGEFALSDSNISVHLYLSVKHAFELQFPAGSDRAILEPVGGWGQWTDYGKVPTALRRELPFLISSSGQLSIRLECQYPATDQRCAIRNATTTAPDVPVDISVTMPGFREASTAREALNYPLSTSKAAPIFSLDTFALNRRSRLHFAVSGEHVKEMVRHPRSQYRGYATVIFDADP